VGDKTRGSGPSRLATLSWYRYSRLAPDELLARLDDADPLRAMLGEVVEGLEKIRAISRGYTPGSSGDHINTEARALLARLRAATEGGTDDGE
jgi:hypothetical protein